MTHVQPQYLPFLAEQSHGEHYAKLMAEMKRSKAIVNGVQHSTDTGTPRKVLAEESPEGVAMDLDCFDLTTSTIPERYSLSTSRL